MEDNTGLRVSDEDRDRAASEIREHYAQGRLDSSELSERVERVYRARTAGELQAVREDLPVLTQGPAAGRGELAARRAELWRELLQQTGAALVPFLVCTLVWLFSGAQSNFWPAWVAVIAVIPLVRNGWRIYGPAPELDRVAEELERRRRRSGGPPLPPAPPSLGPRGSREL
jgi:hypothetical protein